MKKIFLTLLTLLFVTSLFSNGQQDDENLAEKKEAALTIFTSILPQKYFVERIGADRVDVNVLVGPGKSPATYEPTPGQVLKLSSADIFFTIGVPFEQAFIGNIESNLPKLKIIDTSDGIVKRTILGHDHAEEEVHEHEEEAHGHDEEEDDHHESEIKDPHIWMSPKLVKIQAAAIYNALIKEDPKGQEIYAKGYNDFIKDLDLIHEELKNVLEPLRGNLVFVYHPAFGYLFDEFGLEQMSVETGGKEPTPAVLEEVITMALEKKVKIIFVQPEFSQKSAQVIAKAIDGVVVQLNPLNPDYINNLRHIALEIEKVFN